MMGHMAMIDEVRRTTTAGGMGGNRSSVYVGDDNSRSTMVATAVESRNSKVISMSYNG